MAPVRIGDVSVFSFALSLRRALQLKNVESYERRGFLIRLSNDAGEIGWGEISPLPSFSRETLEEAREQLSMLRDVLKGVKMPAHAENLDGALTDLTASMRLSPSAQFGVETALLNLVAQHKELTLSALLGGPSASSVPINALASGTPEEIVETVKGACGDGFRTVKIKVGRSSVDEDIHIVNKVCSFVNDNALEHCAVRLDANRAWSYTDAIRFASQVPKDRIEYIEEPCSHLEDSYRFGRASGMPLALDESLIELTPDKVTGSDEVAALVLKPTIMGGIEYIAQFTRKAQSIGAKTVMSSSFESSIGILTLAHLAAALGSSDMAHGFDTLSWFQTDLLPSPLRIEHGRLELRDTNGETARPIPDMLTEVTDG
jgi:O-succinylbenzoate synthase